jgi:hypothetical protein
LSRGRARRPSAGTIEIQVDRWSTDAQRDRLVKALLTKGADKPLDTLRDTPVMGHFNSSGRLGIDIRFARHYPGEDGGGRVGRMSIATPVLLTQVKRSSSIN